MKRMFFSLMIGLGSSLTTNMAFGSQAHEEVNLSRLDTAINEARPMWNKYTEKILLDNDPKKAKDLIVERFKWAEVQPNNNWKQCAAWNLETYFCCALALLKHTRMDLSSVLSCKDYIKDGLQESLGLCILTVAECQERNIAVSIAPSNQRTGLLMYLLGLGKLLKQMKEAKDPKLGSKDTNMLIKLIIWYTYSAQKEGNGFEKIVEEKDDIFDKAVIAFENGTSTKKKNYNLRSRSPKIDEDRNISHDFAVSKNQKHELDVIEIHSSSSYSATEILPERPYKNDSKQDLWKSVPRGQYEVEHSGTR